MRQAVSARGEAVRRGHRRRDAMLARLLELGNPSERVVTQSKESKTRPAPRHDSPAAGYFASVKFAKKGRSL